MSIERWEFLSLSNVVIFRFHGLCSGHKSSSFILNTTVRYHMLKFQKDDPKFVETVINSLYCDDLVGSVNDENECLLLYEKLKKMICTRGFQHAKVGV